MTPVPRAIPEAYYERAIALDHLGVAEVSWKRTDVFEIIASLADTDWAILCGDVLRSDGRGYQHTGDSWHSDSRDGEARRDFISRSHHETLAYVRRYLESGDVSYVLVFDESA